MTEPVLVHSTGGVRTLTLNRADNRNALTNELRDALADAVRDADRDPAVRAVILTGRDGVFCAGGNIKTMFGRDTISWYDHMNMIKSQLVRPLLELRKPMIAALNGWTIGAGVSIALTADIRIASSDAVFGLAFSRIGLIPDMASIRLLPRVVGLGVAKQMAMLGEQFDAAAVLRWGLVTEVTEPDDLARRALQIAERLANGPSKSIELIKQLIDSAFETGLDAALRAETMAQTIAASTADHAEGIAAFVARRPPEFGGW